MEELLWRGADGAIKSPSKARKENDIEFAIIAMQLDALSLCIWPLAGCNSTELVSERSFEEKTESLRVGQTNRTDVEALLGTANVVERSRPDYYFADVEFGVGVHRYAPPSGPLPINADPFPSNTRGVITAGFKDAGHLRHLVVERYFDQPFIND